MTLFTSLVVAEMESFKSVTMVVACMKTKQSDALGMTGVKKNKRSKGKITMEQREPKFQFIYGYLNVFRTATFTLTELMDMFEDDVFIKATECTCQSIGETNVSECNCDLFYDKFSLVAKRQYSGLKDHKENEIYEGDIIDLSCSWDEHRKGIVVFDQGCFEVRNIKKCDDTGLLVDILHVYGNASVIGNIYENTELLGGEPHD